MLILNSLFILGKERITIGNPDIGLSFYGREAFNFFSSFLTICSILIIFLSRYRQTYVQDI